MPTVGERISSFTGQRPFLVWILGLSGFGLLVSVVVMEIRRRIGMTQLGHRPATVTGPSLQDDEGADETPELQAPKRFIGGPRQVSVQLKASEPALRRAVIPVAKRVPDPVIVPTPEPEETAINGRTTEPAYVDFEGSSVGPVIEQVPTNGEKDVAPEATAFASPVYDEPAVSDETPVSDEPAVSEELSVSDEPVVSYERPACSEPTVSYEPAVEQAEAEPVAAFAEDTFPTQRAHEWEVSEPVEAQASLQAEVYEPTTADAVASSEIGEQISTQELSPEPEQEPELVAAVGEETFPTEPVSQWEVSEFGEAPASVLETQVCEPATAEVGVPSEVEEQISIQESSPEPVPVEQGQPVPYQTVVTAEEPIQAEAAQGPENAEIAGVGRAIAGISALQETPEIPPASEEEYFAQQPTPIETMPETVQTPTAPVIRTSGGPTQPANTAPAPQAAAGGMHTAVQITLSCEIASMQLTPTFKMGALQLRPISKVVTMRLASSPQQQQAAMNLQVNFEIAKIQAAAGSLGQLRVNPSQQQKPATLATPSFNISGLQLVSGFESAPLQLTPSHQAQTSVHLTAAFQITSVEFSAAFEIADIILNSTSKTVAVQLPGMGAPSLENAPMFEITNVQMADNGEIAMLQLNPVAKRG
jgi:hypothetical protein